MNYRIRFADGTVFTQPETPTLVVSPLRTADRDWMRICVTATADAVKAAFVDNAQYAQVWDSVQEDITEDGTQTPIVEALSRDLSVYSVAGEVIDHRDGTVTVLMGKPTQTESAQYDVMAKVIREGVEQIDE